MLEIASRDGRYARNVDTRRAVRVAVHFLIVLAALLPAAAEAQTLPADWAVVDVGNPAIPGYATYSGGSFTVSGAGGDIGGTSDQFTFVYRKLTGDGTIVARVASLQNTDPSAKAGLMMRYSLSRSSRNAFALVTPSRIVFQRRQSDGGTTLSTTATGVAPVWLKVTRRGALVTASASSNGITWTEIGTDIVPMSGGPMYVGLAVTSHNTAAPTLATMTNVQVVSLAESGLPLPTGWSAGDLGSPALRGAAAYDPTSSRGTFGLMGAGTGISGSWDQFHFAYRQVDGDLDIVARVDDLGDTTAWSKAGVMIREALTPNASHASMLISSANGAVFQRRPVSGGMTVSSAPNTIRVPRYVKLSLRSGVVTAYHSMNGTTWTGMGTEILTLPSPFYVGLVVTSDDPNASVTTNIRNVVVQAASPNQAPTVSLSAPINGATYAASAAVTITANASDADGTISRVDFYSGATLIGSDTTSPFEMTWSAVPAGSYSITAVATDDGGATTTSTAVSVTVNGANQPPSVSLTAPANGSTFTAPASITVSATASDTDGTIARVDFYEGSTLIGSSTTSPYSVTWNSVPAGPYSLTARAIDDDGAAAVSAPRTITVSPAANQPPSVSLTAPANGSTFTGPASITISATASDNDGTIARIDFYQGSTLVGSDTTSPYSVTWNSVPAGSYSLTARATDDDGATGASAPRTVSVNPPPNQPPSVSLTAPVNGASFIAPASVTVSADASDSDGAVARVDFYVGTTLIGSDTTSPYNVVWSNVPAGSYSLTAVATDHDGATTASSARSIIVAPTAVRQTTIFNASPDHNTLVNSYLFEIFLPGVDTTTAVPIASQNLGKPAPVIGEITADVTATINNLAAGPYQATVAAVGTAGSARSTPVTLTR